MYIKGIFNYCDRWCQRCAFTLRCSTFALEQKLNEANKGGKTSTEDFWEIFDSIFDNTMLSTSDSDCVDKFPLEEDSVDDFPTNANTLETQKDETIEEHFLYKAARSYSKDTFDWMELFEKEIKIITEHKEIDKEHLADALEIVQHYAFFITVKLARAISGLHENITEFEEDSDAQGTAKVALITMNRSIRAWSIIRSVFKKDPDVTTRFIGVLIALRRATEEVFPKAMEFIRPGFDTE